MSKQNMRRTRAFFVMLLLSLLVPILIPPVGNGVVTLCIVSFVLWVVSVHWSNKLEAARPWLGSSLGLAIMITFVLVTRAMVPALNNPVYQDRLLDTTDIVSLERGVEVAGSGKFQLGFGKMSVGSYVVYYAYTKTHDGGLQIFSTSAGRTVLYEVNDGRPRVETHVACALYTRTNAFWRYVTKAEEEYLVCNSHGYQKVFVPPNTVKIEFHG